MKCTNPQSIRPQYLQNAGGTEKPHSILVGCGKCLSCRQKRSRDWILRLKHEHQQSTKSLFLTLTYDDDQIPMSENGLPTLNKRDFQLFMKKLRKKSPLTLKYYAIGEYGSRTMRPHYHAIMFNASEKHITEIWDKGITHVGQVTGKSMAYVTGYTNKYILNKYTRQDGDDRLNQFNLISKGLGKGLVTQQLQDYYNHAQSDIIKVDGDTFTLPRYVKDKMLLCDDAKDTIAQKKAEFFFDDNLQTRKDLIKKLGKKQFDKFKNDNFISFVNNQKI